MATSKKNAFSRRLPDLVTEELVAALSSKESFEFKALFEVVHAALRARNAASGGEEMLRLRAYEKLQSLVSRGMVKKTLKQYQGLPNLHKALPPPPVPLGGAPGDVPVEGGAPVAQGSENGGTPVEVVSSAPAAVAAS